MSTTEVRSLGRMPLHGGWAALRFAEPRWHTTPGPGQLLTVHQPGSAFSLPLYRCAEETVTLLAPPALAAVAPAAGTPATIASPVASIPRRPDDGQEALVLGIDAGLGGALALAEWLAPAPTLVIVGGRAGVPSRPRPSRYLVPHLPPEAIACLPQLEELGIASRIALEDWQPGCFDEGPVMLLERYLAELPEARRTRMMLYACVPAGDLNPLLPGLRQTLAGVHLVEVPTAGTD